MPKPWELLFECPHCHRRRVVSAASMEEATRLAHPGLDLFDRSCTICPHCGQRMKQISWPRGPGLLLGLAGLLLLGAGGLAHFQLGSLSLGIMGYVLGGLILLASGRGRRVDAREDGIRFW
jgi:hypothetical protein